MKFFLSVLAFSAFMIVGCEEETPPCPGCSLVPDPGPCEAYIPKYYFDPVDETCKEFIWGGCGGEVPFESMAECEACRCEDD